MKIISSDDKYVASTWGAAIHLKAGEPKEVSDELGLLCLQEGCSQYEGEIPTNPVVEETPVIDEGSGGAAEEVPVEESVVAEIVTPDLHSMTKIQLEEYGRTVGVELDRRKKKTVLIEELEAL